MSRFLLISLFALCLGAPLAAQAPAAQGLATIKVNYAAEDSVYIDAGRNAGIAEGMMLTIRRATVLSIGGDSQLKGRIVVATCQVVSVSQNSAMCSIRSKNLEIRPGDLVMAAPRAESAPRPHTAPAERTEPQSFAPPPGSLSERTVVNVPTPENPWKETAPHGYTIGGSGSGSVTTSAPKSLPEQMAENERNKRRQQAQEQSASNGSKSLAEQAAENARQRRAGGTVVAQQTPSPVIPAAMPAVEAQKPAEAATVAADPRPKPAVKPVEQQPAVAANAAKPQPIAPASTGQQPLPAQSTTAQAAPVSPQKTSPSIFPEPPRTAVAARERTVPVPDTAAGGKTIAPEQAKQSLPAMKTTADKAASPATTMVAAARPADIPSSASRTPATPTNAPALTPVSGPSADAPNRASFKVK